MPIARVMNAPDAGAGLGPPMPPIRPGPPTTDELALRAGPQVQANGGGNLNGSSNTAHMMGQAGTGADRLSLPRKPPNAGNFCGVV